MCIRDSLVNLTVLVIFFCYFEQCLIVYRIIRAVVGLSVILIKVLNKVYNSLSYLCNGFNSVVHVTIWKIKIHSKILRKENNFL